MKNSYIIALSVLAACAAFLVIFRIRKVQKAYLKVKYDHFVDGTVLEAGQYLGYAVKVFDDKDVILQGTTYSGAYPQEDIRLEPGFVLENRFNS